MKALTLFPLKQISYMKKIFAPLLCLLFAVTASAKSDYRISYTVDVDTAGHYLNVHMTYVPKTHLSDPLTLKLPVWAPGYYLIVDFPKYVTDFSASADKGTMSWKKEGKNAWVITAPEADTIRADYRVYCNKHSVAECYITSQEAFIAPNGIFMHASDTQHPVSVTFNMPDNWAKCSTGMKPSASAQHSITYDVENFDVLYDSPLLMGNHHTHEFTLEGHHYDIALSTPDGYAESGIEEDWKKVVSAATKLIGDVPYDNYCLIHLGEGRGGLEHSNSQACYSEGTWRFRDRASYVNYLGFMTHEYFHLYNVKSIRPIELGPFDYDREVFTPLLWVSEGFTVYYETQLMLRAGVITQEEMLSELSAYIKDIETNEGQKHMSLRQSSYDIWLNFFNDIENKDDVRISYYIKGPVIGLVFDCYLRKATDGKCSLDDLMRLLYNRYFKELKRGFTEEEFWQAADEVAAASGSNSSVVSPSSVLRPLVDTTAPIDYDFFLSPVGLQLDKNTYQLSLQQKQ